MGIGGTPGVGSKQLKSDAAILIERFVTCCEGTKEGIIPNRPATY